MVSRNSASSRAIPFERMKKRVLEEPFIPLRFQKDHKGMQGEDYLKGDDEKEARRLWLVARDKAVHIAKLMNRETGVTKQLCNRLLEPFQWQTIICSATEWENFFALRAHEAAEIHIQKIAYMMLEAYNENTPTQLREGEWHIPFGDKIDKKRITELKEWERPSIDGEEVYLDDFKVKIATARCARVSYLNFEGKDDYGADIVLHDRLSEQGHWSPFEHCAIANNDKKRSGNFVGFTQYRKTFPNENRAEPRVK